MSKGIAIVLSWPETCCKQAGAWYDPLMSLVGINKNGYYKVGHAAIVLIQKETGDCLYFDFGRYHTPVGYGRVRSACTDHDLAVLTQARFDDDGCLINEAAILQEIYHNRSCHGDGYMLSCQTIIDYNQSIMAVQKLQNKVFLRYGPFVWRGTNCSRFVVHVLLRSEISLGLKMRLIFQPSISPSPKGNIMAIRHQVSKTGVEEYEEIPEKAGESTDMEMYLS